MPGLRAGVLRIGGGAALTPITGFSRLSSVAVGGSAGAGTSLTSSSTGAAVVGVGLAGLLYLDLTRFNVVQSNTKS